MVSVPVRKPQVMCITIAWTAFVLFSMMHGLLGQAAVYGVSSAAVGAAGVVCVFLSRRADQLDNRMFWVLLAVGNFLFALGEGVCSLRLLATDAPLPFPSFFDSLYLSLPLFYSAGLIYKFYKNYGPRLSVLVIADLLITILVLITFGWYNYLIPYTLNFEATLNVSLLSVLHLLFGFGLVFFLLINGLFYKKTFEHVHYPMFFTAILIFALSDIGYLVFAMNGSPRLSWCILAWPVFALMAASSGFYRMKEQKKAAKLPLLKKIAVMLPYLGVFLVLYVMIDIKEKVTPVYVSAMGAVILVFFRYMLTVFQNSKLVLQLRQANEGLETVVRERTEELETALNKIEMQAHYDALTHLPNRVKLEEKFQDFLDHAKQGGTRFAVLFLDLDRFKMINDTLGHQTGDDFLRCVGERLKGMEEIEMASRLGGDEFILVTKTGDDMFFRRTAERIVYDISRRFNVRDHELYTTTSVGVSIFPDDGDDKETLIRNADFAMYKAKSSGKNTFRFYSQNAQGLPEIKEPLETMSREAAESDERPFNASSCVIELDAFRKG
ncbi:MAG TPA: GGDEF domain-containing protein [Bacillales bacterium]|nr:GGDEF domain-containing protein [Bacillales bacterium]